MSPKRERGLGVASPRTHRFHRMKGGFLSVSVSRSGDESILAFRFYDVHGKLVYEHKEKRPIR